MICSVFIRVAKQASKSIMARGYKLARFVLLRIYIYNIIQYAFIKPFQNCRRCFLF